MMRDGQYGKRGVVLLAVAVVHPRGEDFVLEVDLFRKAGKGTSI